MRWRSALYLAGIVAAGVIGSACGNTPMRPQPIALPLTPPNCDKGFRATSNSEELIVGIIKPGVTANQTYRAWDKLWLRSPQCQVVGKAYLDTGSGNVALQLRPHFTSSQELKVENDLMGTGLFGSYEVSGQVTGQVSGM